MASERIGPEIEYQAQSAESLTGRANAIRSTVSMLKGELGKTSHIHFFKRRKLMSIIQEDTAKIKELEDKTRTSTTLDAAMVEAEQRLTR